MAQLHFIHSGSAILNCALTGHPLRGWPLGRMSNIIGDKSTGKTLLAIEAATMFCKNPPAGISPRVLYAELESAFDTAYAESLGLPVEQVDFMQGVDTLEEFWTRLEEYLGELNEDEGALVIVDSWDALSSKDEEEAKDPTNGGYDMKKQKQAGKMFRKLIRKMGRTNTHLMVISQIRENITTLPFAPKFRRSGGKALDFYATHLVWLYEQGKLKNKKTERVYGLEILAKITKNKVSAAHREAEFPIIFGHGVDDTYSSIMFLTHKALPKELSVKKETGGYYVFADQKLYLHDLVDHIEQDPELYRDLMRMVHKAWHYLEDATRVDRVDKSTLVHTAMDLDAEFDMGELPDEPDLDDDEDDEGEEENETVPSTAPRRQFRRGGSTTDFD